MKADFTIDWPDWSRTDEAFEALEQFDATPLMAKWCDIIVEGNRRGVLSGVDGKNQPMPALKYRNGAGKATKNRRVPKFGTTKHESTPLGFDDNLTTAQYRQYTGPRLAPRRELSRAISNLFTEIRSDPEAGLWEAVGAWHNVVSAKGVPFLPYHFEGAGRLPRYDLRPVRPEDFEFALNALKAFIDNLFLVRF